jgi:hypothetical protein
MNRNHESNKFTFIKRVLRSVFVKNGLKSALIKCRPELFLEREELNYIIFN